MRAPMKEGLFEIALLAALAAPSAGCAQVFGLDKQYVDTSASTGGGGSAGSGGASGGAAGSGGASSGGSTTSSTDPKPCKMDLDCPSVALCKTAKCVLGSCENSPAAAGMPCLPGSTKMCDGMGACVECLKDADCKSAKCILGVCSVSCQDGLKNGQESDVDCGGPTCPKCVDLHHCNAATDCASAYCDIQNLCAPPACGDGVKDGVETDIDCGGGQCAKCLANRHCNLPTDCVGNVCTGATKHCIGGNNYCDDGLQDVGETDVDCGGDGKDCKSKCATGLHCLANTDCNSNLCMDDVCAPSCTDGMKNNAETDVDCGGGTCSKCPTGKMCLMNADCKGGLCTTGVCQPTCTDGVKNNSETDIDCGGPTCSKCPTGKLCQASSDCASAVCNGGICL